MPAGNYTISGSIPVTIYQQSNQDTSRIYNAGPNDALVSDYSDLTSATGFMVKVGDSISWNAGRNLYAICPSGTANLSISSSVGDVFSASSVAAQILSQGLASAIATDISLSGAPSIDVPNTLINHHFTTVSNTNPSSEPLINLSAYASIAVQYTESAIGINPVTVIRTIIFNWYEDAAQSVLAETDYINVACQTGTLTAIIPRRAAYLAISYGNAVTTVNTNAVMVVTGSYRNVNSARIFNGNGIPGQLTQVTGGSNVALNGNDGLCIYTGSCPAATTQSAYPSFYPGLAEIDWYSGATGTSLIILTADTAYRIVNFITPNAAVSRQFIMPNYPCELRFINTLAGPITYAFSLRFLSAFQT